MKSLFILTAIIALVSCQGNSGGGSSEKKPGKQETTTCDAQGVCTTVITDSEERSSNDVDVTIEDNYGREYFEQFIFKKEEVGDDPDFPEYQYRYLMAGLGERYTSAEGKDVSANMSIGLFTDGTFKATYSVIEHINDVHFNSLGCKEVVGTWDVYGDMIELADQDGQKYLTGIKSFRDDNHTILFSVITPLFANPTQQLKLDMSYGYANSQFPEEMLFKCLFGAGK